MRFQPAMLLAAMLTMAACSPSLVGDAQATSPRAGTLPESVVSIADPNQDLRSASLQPEDGCYWYQYAGPVETTLLPLRTVEGRPICARPAS